MVGFASDRHIIFRSDNFVILVQKSVMVVGIGAKNEIHEFLGRYAGTTRYRVLEGVTRQHLLG